MPLPRKLPDTLAPASDTAVRQFDAIVDRFGFMTIERVGRRTWNAVVYSVAGEPLRSCRIKERRSVCA
ncbi:MAG: hypothetical protein ACXWIW_09085 [Croceibacterium sp.]